MFERRWTLCLLLQELQGLGRGENFNNGQNKTWDLTRASTVLLKTITEPALFGVRKCPFYHLPGARFAGRALDTLTNICLVQRLQRVYQGTKDG
jgi:hypothetical protein